MKMREKSFIHNKLVSNSLDFPVLICVILSKQNVANLDNIVVLMIKLD